MKTPKEVEALAEGDILYDKLSYDKNGNPLSYKITGPHQKARHNEEYFIRRMELIEDEKPEGEDAESVRGYYSINPENLDQFCKDEEIARVYHLLYKMEDGITVKLRNALWEVVDKILQKPSVQERFKGLDLMAPS